MRLLALDIATVTGVAVGETSGAPVCFSERLGEAGAPHGHRFSRMLEFTAWLIKRHDPEAIALEAAIAAGPAGGAERVQLAMGLRATVLAIAYRKRVRVYEYPVSAIRKHFIGRSGMKRAEAKKATLSRCAQIGWSVQNDNEADAAAVWEYSRARLRLGTLPVNGGLGL